MRSNNFDLKYSTSMCQEVKAQPKNYCCCEPFLKCPWRKRNHEGAAGALWCGLSEFFDISGYDLKKIVEYLGASVC